jgi:hypothetical protein
VHEATQARAERAIDSGEWCLTRQQWFWLIFIVIHKRGECARQVGVWQLVSISEGSTARVAGPDRKP